MRKRDIPNTITIIRFLLIFPVIWGLLQSEYLLALYLFVIAGVSDGIDGFLARHYDWRSRFGSIVDPLVDKCLMLSTFFTLVWLQLMPLWLFAIIILRDAFILAGCRSSLLKENRV